MSRSLAALLVCAVSFLFLFSVSSRSNRHASVPAPIDRAPAASVAGSETFTRDLVAVILSHPRCAGLKAYYGLDDEGKPAVVLVGVDRDGNDILDGALAGGGSWCPPVCGGSGAGQPQ